MSFVVVGVEVFTETESPALAGRTIVGQANSRRQYHVQAASAISVSRRIRVVRQNTFPLLGGARIKILPARCAPRCAGAQRGQYIGECARRTGPRRLGTPSRRSKCGL